MAITLHNRANVYCELKQWNKAIELLKKAVEINTLKKRRKKLADNYMLLGKAYNQTSFFNKAASCFRKMVSIHTQFKNRYPQKLAIAYLELGKVQIKTRQFVQAETNLLQAYSRFQTKSSFTKKTLESLVVLYQTTDDRKKQIKYQQLLQAK